MRALSIGLLTLFIGCGSSTQNSEIDTLTGNPQMNSEEFSLVKPGQIQEAGPQQVDISYSCSMNEVRCVPSEYATISAAITSASNGNVVLVSPGTYEEFISFGGKDLILKSTEGPSVTTIKAPRYASSGNTIQGTLVTFSGRETRNAQLDGFTLRDAWNVGSGAIVIHGGYSPNDPYHQLDPDSSPTIQRNIIVSNSGSRFPFAGGIHIWGRSSAMIRNNVIFGNHGPGISLLRNIGTTEVINNTIVGNSDNTLSGGPNSAGIAIDQSSPRVRNNIVWGNGSLNMGITGASAAVVTYNDIQGGWLGTGNLNVDPLFISPETNDYRVQNYVSPCIDAGDPADNYSQEPDFNGNRINMGAEGGTKGAALSAERLQVDGTSAEFSNLDL